MSADIECRGGAERLKVSRPLDSTVLVIKSSSPALDGAPVIDAVTTSGDFMGEYHEIVGEHSQPDPPLHAAGASVAAPPQSVTAFERADPSLAAGAPPQRGP